MKYQLLNGKKVRVYFRPTKSFGGVGFYGLDDVKVGELRIVNDQYKLYPIMLDINRTELIADSPYRFNENQVDSIFSLN